MREAAKQPARLTRYGTLDLPLSQGGGRASARHAAAITRLGGRSRASLRTE